MARREFRDFSGGLNLRDAPSQMADNESLDTWNVTFYRRGGVGARLGYAKYNGSAFGASTVRNIYWSGLLSDKLTQAGASLYKGTSTSAVKTFTTSVRVGIVDFVDRVYALHPVDGLWQSTDGVTWAAVADPDAPLGDVLAVWQNKLYAAGHPTNKARVSWSDAGNGQAWTASSFNDLREKDNEKVVALGGASGLDVQGRGGLLAFKQRSSYRIYDSATGAYVTIDTQIGAASALAVTNLDGRTYTIGERGIHSTSGTSPMRPESDRLRPLWHRTQIALDQLSLFCAGQWNGRAYFSLPRAGSTANDVALELDPVTGSIAAGSNAVSCYATDLTNTEKLYGGSPTVVGQVYELYTGGTDDGAAITSRFQTRWFELDGSFLVQLWRLRFLGRGTLTANFRTDYSTLVGADHTLTLTDPAGIAYDTGLTYDTGLLYVQPTASEYTQDVYPAGALKSFSIVFRATTSTTDSLPALLSTGTNPEVGAWSLFGIDALLVPLSIG